MPKSIFRVDKSKPKYCAHHRFSFDNFYTVIDLDDCHCLVNDFCTFCDIVILEDVALFKVGLLTQNAAIS